MRHVAVALVALLCAAALPVTGATNDCAGGATGTNPCVAVLPPEQTPSQVPARGFYVWLAAYKCAPSFGSACSGRPAEGAVVGFVGIVYEETNKMDGLQRFKSKIGSADYPPDRMLLL